MARPAKSLLERVLANSFRPGRYGELLARQGLPRHSPFRDQRRRELWQALRHVQRLYHDDPAPELREQYASQFSQLVRALHGARLPSWYLAHRAGRASARRLSR